MPILTVQPGGLPQGDEELAAVCVPTRVRHWKGAGEVRYGKWLVGERAAVDGLAAGAVASIKISALEDKALDDAVERAVLVCILK